MSFALWFVRPSKKINVHLCQKMPFVLACFDASAAPRPENSDSDEKDAFLPCIFSGTISKIMYSLLSFPLKQYRYVLMNFADFLCKTISSPPFVVNFGGSSDFQNRLLNKIEKFFKFGE
jgi:hypothetical protein